MSELLRSAFDTAHRTHPDVLVSESAFGDYLAERVENIVDTPDDVMADLYLACGCLAGDSAALTCFDQQLLSQVPSFLARIDRSKAFVDEVAQRARERLLVGTADALPKIHAYRGRSRLGSWLRVVVIRLALDLKASVRPTSDIDAAGGDVADELSAGHDPELDYLRSRYQAEFQRAFVDALETLAPRDRTVLRMNLLDGLNIDAIGQMFDVHRGTVARWIADAREQLFDKTRAALHAELGVSPTEFASLVRLVRSQLDVSICRILSEHEQARSEMRPSAT